MALAVLSYRATEDLPASEQFGLVFQVRKAAVSVPSNIAEGSERGTKREFLRFVRIAKGSVAELETQILLTVDLELLDPESVEDLLEQASEVGRMLNGLEKSLRSVDQRDESEYGH